MLKNTLLLNALFSSFSAIVMLFAGAFLSQEIPLPQWFWISTAIGLLGFAVMLIFTSLDTSRMRTLSSSIIAGDIAWVVLSAIAFVIWMEQLSPTGSLMIWGVNAAVGSFALLQYLGLRQLSNETSSEV